MAEYPGATWAGGSPNKAPREGQVELFIVHHWAGGYGGNREAAARGQRDVFMRPNARRVSPNFQVNADGSVWEIVPPDRYRAWTTGLIDHKAVTVETQNISGAPHWGISQESHEAIARLVAWAAQRYGFPIQRGEVAKGNRIIKPGVIGHNEAPTAATACPGPSMNLDWIVNRARQIASGAPASNGASSIPAPPKEEDDMLMLRISGAYLCALGPGIFRHFIASDPYEKIKNVARVNDDWQDVSLSELPALLRTYGCDLNIWDVRPGVGFVVLDPLTNEVNPGRAWTASGAVRAAIAGIKLPEVDPTPLVEAIKEAIAESSIPAEVDELAIAKAVRGEFTVNPLA